MFGYPSIIEYDQQRYVCKNYEKCFNDKNPLTSKNTRISSDLKISILKECENVQSIKNISKSSNISYSSTYNIFTSIDVVSRNQLSEILCIDEFKAGTEYSKYACIFGNPINGEILDILPRRTQEYITNYLLTLDESEPNKVKYIVTDMNEAYRTIIRRHFPNAVHIAERFH